MPEFTSKIICGVDEAGRGPLAGPVTAAAVVLSRDFPVSILRDSKALKEQLRSEIAVIIREKALDYAVGWSWPDEIDKINIHHATLLSMYRALEKLKLKPYLIQVDGKFVPELPPGFSSETEAVVKGDSKIPEIMAASILAKTARDLWMINYSKTDSRYNFEQHKGYPTKLHREKIKLFGYSAIHRRSFSVKF